MGASGSPRGLRAALLSSTSPRGESARLSSRDSRERGGGEKIHSGSPWGRAGMSCPRMMPPMCPLRVLAQLGAWEKGDLPAPASRKGRPKRNHDQTEAVHQRHWLCDLV